MPSATEGPTVTLSFANNFWGKDDAGVGPLLDRMASAKQTSDELRSFYGARASIEDDYARKLQSLCRKSLGSHEMGSLKASLDTVRGEVESMAKQHASIAAQMKTELEEPLAAFAGGMKERRKIIQNTIEKLLKVKIQQTNAVNKTRDRYEQDCLRIKGYLAQGHMVMGQEERKNKAKLEKTQISLATSNAEYEAAVKALEDTTARWNREWKAAADKFQDLEEERLDFTKSSLWTFANIASTVCVSDDASCEKVRLSLEKMDVEKDIMHFINEKGTGQEIPDPPKYINFCRGDVEDHKSEVSDDDNYSVAQFPRCINPAFRTSSPQPSTFESHHDPNSALARDLGHQEPMESLHEEPTIPPPSSHRAQTMPLQNIPPQPIPPPNGQAQAMPTQNSHTQIMPLNNSHPQMMPLLNGHPQVISLQNNWPQHMPPPPGHPAAMAPQISQLPIHIPQDPHVNQDRRAIRSKQQYDTSQFSEVPHDPYPMDGMTMLCRTDSNLPSRFDAMKSAPAPAASSRFDGSNPQTSSSVVSARYEGTNGRYEGMNSAQKENTTSRFDGVAKPTTSSSMTRFDDNNNNPAQNSATSSSLSGRYPGLNLTSHSNVSSRLEGLDSATSSNVSARYEAMNSATSSNLSGLDDNSEYSNPTSFSSQEPPSGEVYQTKVAPASASPIKTSPVQTSPVKTSPTKVESAKVEESAAADPQKSIIKKKSGFFQNHSPFRRKSTKEVQPSNRNTWGPVTTTSALSTPRRPQLYQSESQTKTPTQTKAQTQPQPQPQPQTQQQPQPPTQNLFTDRNATPDPIEANATLALNIGQNVFAVANTDKRNQSNDRDAQPQEEMDPIALALAELKGAVDVKQSASRISADRYHGISTPVPDRPQEPSQEPIPEPTRERAQSRAQERPQDRAQSRAQSRAAPDRTPLFSRPVPAPRAGSEAGSGFRGTPPPSYDTPPVTRLGVPPPAVTSKAMQDASRKYTSQTRQILSSSRPASVYNSSAPSRPATRQADVPRAVSPAPPRSHSPRPDMMPDTRQAPRSASPNPYSGSQRSHSPQPSISKPFAASQQSHSPQPSMSRPYSSSQQNPSPQPTTSRPFSRSQQNHSPQTSTSRPFSRSQHNPSPQPSTSRPYSSSQQNNSPQPRPFSASQPTHSPQPSMSKRDTNPGHYTHQNSPVDAQSRAPSPLPFRANEYDRPVSRGGAAMAVQLAPVGVGGEGSVHGSVRSRGSARPGTSSSSRAMSFYEGHDPSAQDNRQRSRSVADPSRQYTPEGRAILHYARALYMYQAAIPEELGFAKGDILAVLRHQDDGWWEAEIHSGNGVGRGGLVPSNYLQAC